MKVFWSDREGKSPPANATFHIRSFTSSYQKTFIGEQISLPPPKTYKILKKTYLPDYSTWKKGVERSLALIRNNELEKVVLGRACTLEFETELDPFAIAAALKQKSEGAYVFCLQFESESFLGATPERLFLRRKDQIITEAVAGTRKRGATLLEDEKLQKELLLSEKDLSEIAPVRRYLENTLSPLCSSPPISSPISVHQTHTVQHLYSCFSGTLKKGIEDPLIIKELHPTPALCGLPKERAFAVIRELEPFERGLYGGVIGWSTEEASEWIVGIRSCLIRGKTATLFSGTGIVEESNAEEEWEELNQKISLYQHIFI